MKDEITPIFQGEVFFAGWSDSHTQGPKITFAIQDADLEAFRDMTIRKGKVAGQRLAVVMVEIGDDEKPVLPSLSQRCALQCKGKQFQQFVAQADGYEMKDGEEQARNFVLNRCGIESRSELDTNGGAAIIWAQIMRDFHSYSS